MRLEPHTLPTASRPTVHSCHWPATWAGADAHRYGSGQGTYQRRQLLTASALRESSHFAVIPASWRTPPRVPRSLASASGRSVDAPSHSPGHVRGGCCRPAPAAQGAAAEGGLGVKRSNRPGGRMVKFLPGATERTDWVVVIPLHSIRGTPASTWAGDRAACPPRWLRGRGGTPGPPMTGRRR